MHITRVNNVPEKTFMTINQLVYCSFTLLYIVGTTVVIYFIDNYM